MSEAFEELSARARRGELSRAEQEQLRFYLNASLEARLWHEAGRQADVEGAVRPGDHDAVERVMRRALAGGAPQSRRRFGAPLSVLAASVLLMASVAAASVAGVGYFRERRSTSAVLAPAVRTKNAPDTSARAMSAAAVASPLAPAPVVSDPGTPPAVSVAPSRPVTSASAREPSGAAELFSAAALARREGNANKAIALLDSLQEQYPGSREARASDVTLGTLHLKRGSAPQALRHFESYSRSLPRGALAPEALWGQFQALSALGRSPEARARLAQLVERFPGSTYGGVARAKLNAEPRRP